MSMLDHAVVAIYLLSMVGIGLWSRRKATSQEEFLVAGRSIGPVLYTGTLAAIIIGGGATVGGVRLGYTYGISGMWLVSMYGLGMIALGLVMVPRILKLRLYTITEILERSYGVPPRIAGALMMSFYDFMMVVVQTISIGAVAEVVFGLPRTETILLCSAVMIGYSVLGGMWALTVTDIVQFVIKTVGFMLILLPVTVIRAGGFEQMEQSLPDGFFSMTHIGWPSIITFFALYFPGLLIAQDGWQRVFTARSVPIARNGAIVVGFYCIAYGAAGAIIGAAGRTLLPPLEDANLAFAMLCELVLPTGVRGLVLSASLAAIMSAATAGLLATSTLLLEDVYLALRGSPGTGTVTQSRVLTAVLGVMAAAAACLMNDVVTALTVGFNLLVGSVFVPIMAAVFSIRGTAQAALLSTLTSAAVVVALMIVMGVDSAFPIYGGLGVSTLVFAITTRLTRRV